MTVLVWSTSSIVILMVFSVDECIVLCIELGFGCGVEVIDLCNFFLSKSTGFTQMKSIYFKCRIVANTRLLTDMGIILNFQERNEIFKGMNSLEGLLNLAIITSKFNNLKDLYYMKSKRKRNITKYRQYQMSRY